MKKTMIRTLSLLTLIILSCVALTSCGLFPATDPFDAKANLERNEYHTVKIDNEGIETVLLIGLHAADVDDFDCVVTGEKDGEYVCIIYFESADHAKAELADVENYAKGRSNYKEDWKIQKIGNMIYFGSSLAIQAASK